MIYIFNISGDEREMLYSALCTSGNFNQKLIGQLASPRTVQLHVDQGQLKALFRALDEVIERYEGPELNDWFRAREFKDVKNSFTAKLRLYFKDVPLEFN